MATKQYIGARYVPKFFEYNNGEWLENTQYEPLTIVQYSGNSYTSKKEVPANIGNPSSNPEYWASTGNYNAQVEAYRQEVEEYKQDVDNRTLFSGKKFVFIGDSYNTTAVGTGWGSKIITDWGLTIGTNVWNSGVGGHGFATGTFLTDLQTLASNIESEVKEQITDLVVVGAINDWGYTQSQVETGFTNFENYAHTTFPNANIQTII